MPLLVIPHFAVECASRPYSRWSKAVPAMTAVFADFPIARRGGMC
jgi:hypothetical protein